ncbi:MAG: alpha/beta hydrolase [Gemmataceae bacterium]
MNATLRSAATLLLIAAPAALAQPPKYDPKDPAGIWEGPLKAGAIELRIAFKIAKDKDGKLTATLDSIDQGAKDVPCTEVSFAEGKLSVEIAKGKAKYAGKMSDDGSTIKGHFEQGGAKLELDLKRVEKLSTVNRPQHPKKPYPYEEAQVEFENAAGKFKLAGTLTLPKGDGPYPAVVLVSGSGPQDRDETLLGHKPFLVIADHLTRKGFAVLRYDDRGVGKSGGKHDTATSADFATDAFAAVQYLGMRKEIDAKRIGVMGHSEGGLIAPIVAAEHPKDVAFIVLLAGPGVPGDEVLLLQQQVISKTMGAKPEAMKLSENLMKAILPAAKEPGPADERKKKIEKAAAEFFEKLPAEDKKRLGDDVKNAQAGVATLSSIWMQYFLAFDPRPTLAKVKCPVLAINGELDLQVVPDQNVAAIEKAVKAGGNDRVTTKVFPKLNHLFQKSKTGAPNEYGQIEETFSPEALEFIAEWLLKLK